MIVTLIAFVALVTMLAFVAFVLLNYHLDVRRVNDGVLRLRKNNRLEGGQGAAGIVIDVERQLVGAFASVYERVDVAGAAGVNGQVLPDLVISRPAQSGHG